MDFARLFTWTEPESYGMLESAVGLGKYVTTKNLRFKTTNPVHQRTPNPSKTPRAGMWKSRPTERNDLFQASPWRMYGVASTPHQSNSR